MSALVSSRSGIKLVLFARGDALAFVVRCHRRHREDARELLSARNARAGRAPAHGATEVASPQDLPSLGVLGWAYLYAGAPERVLDVYERDIEGGYFAGAGNPESLWHTAYAPVRKTERFKSYARRAGLVEYWRAKGWPNACRSTTRDDFICE